MIQKQISTENARSACPLGSSKNDGQLKQLYETAFPKEEQIPWDDLEMTIMMMGPGTFSLHDWDEIVGELRKYWTWDINKD